MSKEKLDSLKTRLETKTNILYNELINDANIHTTVQLRNINFKHGTVIIAPDYYIWTNNSGELEKKIGATKYCTFMLLENIVFNPNHFRITAHEGYSEETYFVGKSQYINFWEADIKRYENDITHCTNTSLLTQNNNDLSFTISGSSFGQADYQATMSNGTKTSPQTLSYHNIWSVLSKSGRPIISDPSGNYYNRRAFGIGFFSAICLHAHDIIIDLNGFSLRQSDEHALNQRFYANIELASVPFITGQGPHDFGDNLQYATRCMIHNGTIGRSSHHGIHGNLCRDIIIKDVNFKNYEVAAVALNGARNVSLIDLDLRGTSKRVPIKGLFSAARFIWEYMQEIEGVDNSTKGTNSNGKITIDGITGDNEDIRKELEALIGKINMQFLDLKTSSFKSKFVDLSGDGNWNGDSSKIFNESTDVGVANNLFVNEKKMSDGNAYGILFNQTGVAVKGFPENRDNPSENILLNNIHVQGQTGWVNEIPVLLDTMGKRMADPVGAVLQTYNNVNSSGIYYGNPVSNSQIIVKKAKDTGFSFFGMNGDKCHCIRGLNIPDTILENISGGYPLYYVDNSGTSQFAYELNGDSMAHVNKGIISFKLDAVENLVAVNCTTSSTKNVTSNYAITQTDLNGWNHANVTSLPNWNYKLYSKGLASSSPAATYRGNNVHVSRGWSLASSKNCYLIDCVARNVESDLGRAYGFDIHQDTDNVFLMNCQAYGVRGGTKIADTDLCNKDEALRMMENPKSIGFRVGQKTTNVTLYNCGVDGTFNAIYNDWIKKFEILSEDVVISHKC